MHQKHFNAPIPVSRLDLLHALVIRGSVSIDEYHTNTLDKAVFGGRYYSDKAPGTVALALPAFAVMAGVLRILGVPLDSKNGWFFSSWAACMGSNAIIAALGGVALFAWLSRRVPCRWALVTTLGLFLGAAPLPYATMMFSHALVVGLIAIALWAIERHSELEGAGRRTEIGRQNSEKQDGADPANQKSEQEKSENPRRPGMGQEQRGIRSWLAANRWDLLAGFSCGWALASEYTAGLVVVGLLFWVVSKGWRRAIPFCLAATPPLLLILAYSYACFGNPFILPYSLQASFLEMNEGLYAIKCPDPEVAYNLLFGPTRGLFFWTPFILMSGFGYWRLAQTNKRLFWVAYAAPLLQIIVISGRAWDWQAGPTLGPRYLAPILPMLALPCALGTERFPRLGIALAVYTVAITTMATLTDACPAGSIYNPLIERNIPLFLKGAFSPNLGSVLGLSPYVSVALYYALLMGGIWWLWRKTKAMDDRQRAIRAAGTP